MQELYKYINIPNFDKVQTELIESINYDYIAKGLHATNVTEEYLTETCPTLMNWLKPRSKDKFRLLRFYFTPGHSELGHHIDGGFCSVPFGLNIPVLNCHNTKMIWYNCEQENRYNPIQNGGYLSAVTPLDTSKLEVIDELELVKPCFTRNDIMHSVKNSNDKVRIMFTVRWSLHPIKFRKIEDVIDTNGLFT